MITTVTVLLGTITNRKGLFLVFNMNKGAIYLFPPNSIWLFALLAREF